MTESGKRLDRLGERIAALQKKDALPEYTGNAPGSNMALGMRIAIEMFAGLLVGGGLGYILDKRLATSPILLIICLFLGVAAGMTNIARIAKRMSDQ